MKRTVHSERVLLYHRIDDPGEPDAMSISPSMFAEQMQSVSRYNARRKRNDPGIRVTFDDGYRDNVENGAPILEQNRVTATFFVAGSSQAHSTPFWWDEIPALVAVQRREWILVELPDKTLRIDIRTKAGQARARRALTKQLRPHTPSTIANALEQLRDGAYDADLRLPPRMDEQEISELARNELFEIGGHTANHGCLASLSAAEIGGEITANLNWLETVTGRRPTSFAYPFGSRASVNDATLEVVRRSGFDRAYVSWPGVTRPWTNRFLVPREIATPASRID